MCNFHKLLIYTTKKRKERNVLFNNTLNTFIYSYLWHRKMMDKDHKMIYACKVFNFKLGVKNVKFIYMHSFSG